MPRGHIWHDERVGNRRAKAIPTQLLCNLARSRARREVGDVGLRWDPIEVHRQVQTSRLKVEEINYLGKLDLAGITVDEGGESHGVAVNAREESERGVRGVTHAQRAQRTR